MYRGQTEFKPPRWQSISITIVAIGLLSGCSLYVAFAGFDWVALALALFTLFAVAGIWETLTTRITLDDSALQVKKWFRLTTISRADIEEVTWGAGVGVAVRHSDGSWTQLPEVGRDSQALCNSVRAWVKAR